MAFRLFSTTPRSNTSKVHSAGKQHRRSKVARQVHPCTLTIRGSQRMSQVDTDEVDTFQGSLLQGFHTPHASALLHYPCTSIL